MSEKEITEAIKEIVSNHWESDNEPLLFSNLPPLLKKVVDGYRDALNGKSLKRFIESSSIASDVKIIRHPKQKAKIGLIPSDESYTYASESDSNSSKKGKINKNTNAVKLLDILSSLTEKDLEKIEMPVSIFVKLYK